MTAVQQEVKEFILKEFLPGEKPEALTDSTPLITGGILDSLATVRLIMFLEETYGIELEPHETGVGYLNTLPEISRLVESRRK